MDPITFAIVIGTGNLLIGGFALFQMRGRKARLNKIYMALIFIGSALVIVGLANLPSSFLSEACKAFSASLLTGSLIRANRLGLLLSLQFSGL